MKSCFCFILLSLLSIYPIENEFSTMSEKSFAESNEAFSIEPIALPQPKTRLKDPDLAFTLSALVPGLGNAYIGDYKTGSSIFAGYTGLIGLASYGYSSNNMDIFLNSITAAQNLYFYGPYAAYRDARNQINNFGFKYAMPQESLADLTLAPFQWQVMKKPEVWGGVLGALTLASVVTYLVTDDQKDAPSASTEYVTTHPFLAFAVGVGEEALFRGALLPMCSELFGPQGGLIASSVLFGMAHIPNANAFEGKTKRNYLIFSVPFITGMGAYMGWLTQKNNSLKESTAFHGWYDYILFAAAYSATNSVINKKPTLSISHTF